MRSNKNTYSPKAFTLAETLAATAILSVPMLAIFGTIKQTGQAVHHSKMLTSAALIAQSQAAELFTSENPRFGQQQGKIDSFNWQTTITQTDIDDLGIAQIAVTWLENQKQKNYTVYTAIKMKTFSQTNNND